MTTLVTVDAHAGWPVLVKKHHTDVGHGDSVEEFTIQPGDKADFYPHQTMWLSITELAHPPKE